MTDSDRRTKIDLDIREDIAVVTLNGPPKNEMDSRFFSDFSAMMKTMPNRKVRGMIIEGAGRHFSSGADVPEIEALGAASTGEVASLLEGNIESFLALQRLSYPTIAVVRGCCLGAGMELALACTHRIAEPNAVFSLPEVTLGIMPGCGGSVRLPLLIGRGLAVELILTGRSVLADEAAALGLAELAPRGRGMHAARQLIFNRSKAE